MHFPAAMQCVGIISILTIQMSRATRYTLRLKLRLLLKLSSTKTYNTQFGDVGKINFLTRKIVTRCVIIVIILTRNIERKIATRLGYNCCSGSPQPLVVHCPVLVLGKPEGGGHLYCQQYCQ